MPINGSSKPADALTSPDAFSMSLYRKPYGDFELTSIRGKIKRIQTRLDELDKAQASAASGPVEDQHDGYTYRENNEIMRVQFIFPGKPDDETRAMLKENGFRWAPSQGPWQRQLTANAKYAPCHGVSGRQRKRIIKADTPAGPHRFKAAPPHLPGINVGNITKTKRSYEP